MGFKVAVVGATGNVGREMMNILAEREFPADEVVAIASRKSLGQEVSYGDKTLKVKALEHYDFSDTDICLMSAGGSVSKEWSPKIAAQGAIVIDNSSAWRYDSDVPLIVPEVNADAVAGFSKRNIIANPNCSTAQLVVALKPLHDKAKIKRVVVATYQSVSGAGKEAMEELFSQTKAVYQLNEVEAKKFPKRIAFNVIPHIDVFQDDGYTREEWKMVVETKKILDPKIKLTATCVRVPVFVEPLGGGQHRVRGADHRGRGARDPAQGAGLPRHRQARERRLRDALRGGRRGRDLHQPHPRGCDGGERALDVDRLRQPAQGRGAQRGADRRVPDQSQADRGEEEGGLEARLREQPRVILDGDRPELARRRVAHRQAPARDAEIGAVDAKLAALDPFAQPRKRQQVVEAVGDVRLFEPYQIIGLGKVAARTELFHRGRHQRHPFADEVAGRERLGVLGESLHAAALRVAEHDDVLHLQAPRRRTRARPRRHARCPSGA